MLIQQTIIKFYYKVVIKFIYIIMNWVNRKRLTSSGESAVPDPIKVSDVEPTFYYKFINLFYL